MTNTSAEQEPTIIIIVIIIIIVVGVVVMMMIIIMMMMRFLLFCFLGFCNHFRDKTKRYCNMKEGNPFGPFWDNFDIDFNDFAEYSPLSCTHEPLARGMWEERYDIVVSR